VSVETLQRAFASTGAVLNLVSPEHLDQPTPCASWQVRELVNHIAGGPSFFAEVAETGAFPSGRDPVDHAAGDFTGTFQRDTILAVQAFSRPGAGDQIVALPFATMPVSAYLWIAASDTFTHGWDLARALGQPTDLDPELARLLLSRAESMLPDALRGEEGQAPFGPPTAPGPGATDADRLAAFFGRRQ
jgi:uncharacterized protein (TIGR03086 family)